MKFSRCAVAMAVLAVPVGLAVVHGVWAQNRQPATNLQPRLEPNSSLPPASLSPQAIEERRQIRYESSIDANGQPQTRGAWEIVPVSVSQPADAETAELAAAEVQAAKEAQELVHELQSVVLEGPKTELKAKLRAALAKQFEAQQKQRTREIASIEERLNKLKETLQKRDAAKDKIVDRRLDQLTGVRDELAWEETQGLQPPINNRLPNTPSPYPPGFSQQPLGVPKTIVPRSGNSFPGAPMLPAPAEIPSSGTIPKATFPTTPVPAAPPVPPAPPARVIPLGVPGTTPAPPPAPPATPALPAQTRADGSSLLQFYYGVRT